MNDFLSYWNLRLNGIRVWLSGSLPERDQSTEEEISAILDLVRRFARTVFQLGGSILHGADPSFTPTLLAEVEARQGRGGKKDSLILAVSRFWSKDPKAVPTESWRKTCIVF